MRDGSEARWATEAEVQDGIVGGIRPWEAEMKAPRATSPST